MKKLLLLTMLTALVSCSSTESPTDAPAYFTREYDRARGGIQLTRVVPGLGGSITFHSDKLIDITGFGLSTGAGTDRIALCQSIVRHGYDYAGLQGSATVYTTDSTQQPLMVEPGRFLSWALDTELVLRRHDTIWVFNEQGQSIYAFSY